ncbi:hypothetical protein NWT09_28245 [Mycolicibacterium sp. jd]|uniref:DUF3263 domain-containing protein n=1 Tax=Mycolicibacterium austroafricanum TaxID=39687 RepID=A0ABT8HMT6_MYCAO|nr:MULTISPECIES: hypothetical protein [Mycolicibacterium]MDN4521855.1 hypothetical protein [Mycolicibacterium austroafricanum]UJL30602.1 hypothetical protein HZU38_09260 [Mycolicibacterium vanbaalenii]WND56292.1 hypothetical protein QQA43_27075 [Mycolicibacterium vanbaalenii]
MADDTAVVSHKHDAAGEPLSPTRIDGRARVRYGFAVVSADRFEQDMVEFVIRWRRYGGGCAADIFEEFGLSEAEFFRRVFVLVTAPSVDLVIDRVVLSQIRRTCLTRLRGLGAAARRA